MSTQCPFCDRSALRERLILGSANFSVIPTKGQVLEGYTLIVPKRHTICFGDFSETEMDEAAMLMERVRTATTNVYGRPPIFFEHGIVGQTVKHAHMHAVPAAVDLLPIITDDFPDYEKVTTLAALQAVFQREGPYLFYQNAGGEKFVFHIFKWPQYLRLMLADAVGHPERGNWREMDPQLDAAMMLDTQTKLSRELMRDPPLLDGKQ